MPITVLSPYSGRPVKVRDQDVGRAIKDEEGRIFYALPRGDGKGYYGAMTRAGGAKDEQRALDFEAKLAGQASFAKEVQAAHDATGRRRSHLRGKLVVLFLFLIVLLLAYMFTIGPFGTLTWQKGPAANPMPLDRPAPPPATAPAPGAHPV